MKTLLLITAQVHENYADTSIPNWTPHWKPKTGQVFSLNADADAFMYVEKECIKAIQTLLDNVSNNMCKYTYVSHELIFSGIDELNDIAFANELIKECEATSKESK